MLSEKKIRRIKYVPFEDAAIFFWQFLLTTCRIKLPFARLHKLHVLVCFDI